MPEQATKAEIERAVLSCCEPMSVIQDPDVAHSPFDLGMRTLASAGVPRRFTVVEGQPGAGQFAYVVSPDRLCEALASMKFERATEDEAVQDLRATATAIRDELRRKVEGSWEAEFSARQHIEAIDAFIAGLELRVPTLLQSDFARMSERLAKEADPKWSEYRTLHAKFDGERPG